MDILTFLMPLLQFITLYMPLSVFREYNAKEVLHVRDLKQTFNAMTQYPILNFIGLVEKHGYAAQEHIVFSDDGYELALHRIYASPKSPPAKQKPVVYIQHGILLSSDSWVLMGPEKDLAFLLADAGYDVWLGNVRGNTYSKRHRNKSITDRDFWNFGYYEMAVYDIKAFIDHILFTTGEEKMSYIGYSMGTTLNYAFLSTYPEYNQRFRLVQSLAPVVYWKNELRKAPAFVKSIFPLFKQIVSQLNLHELLPQSAVTAEFGKKFCSDGSLIQGRCAAIISNIGLDINRVNWTTLPTILEHFPAGTSVLNVLNYNQNFANHTFAAYDFGPAGNIKKYGSHEAPAFNVHNVRAPVSIWYAESDDIVNPKDVHILSKTLQNIVSCKKVALKNFNHFDFLWANDARKLVYEFLIEELNNAESRR